MAVEANIRTQSPFSSKDNWKSLGELAQKLVGQAK